jgi:hypothetical protein
MTKRGRFFLASRVSVYRGDDAAMGAYAGLPALAALFQANWRKQVVQFLTTSDRPPHIELADEEAPWRREDFAAIERNLRKRSFFTNFDETGLTTEFPWAPGAVTAAAHHRTSLFTMWPDRNPILGNGLLLKLELPATFTDPSATADALNDAEYDATDAVPFVGAWCPANEDSVAFITFLPNLAYALRMHETMAVWNVHRSSTAKRLIEEAAGCGGN